MISFKSKDLLSQHNNEKEEPINLDLGVLKIKHILKNENRICFFEKEKEGIKKLSKKIQEEMGFYKKEPISMFFSEKEIIYNPESDKLMHRIKYKDEMVTIPDIGNTQAYSDDERSSIFIILWSSQSSTNMILGFSRFSTSVQLPL
jgi:hypothetical protein